MGIGWGAYWMVYPEYDFYLQGADIRIVHAHNLYLNYAAEIGIPGMLSFMWLFFGSLVLALRQDFLPPKQLAARPTPFDYNEDAAADVELKKVADSVQQPEKMPLVPLWQDFIHWPDWRLLGGAALGLGLAVISVALNGFTDDLLFNIPTSMFLWLLLAFIAAVAELNEPVPEEVEEVWEAPEEKSIPDREEVPAEPTLAEKIKADMEQEKQAAAEAAENAKSTEEAAPQEVAADSAAENAEEIEQTKDAEDVKAESETRTKEADAHEESGEHIKGDH